MGLLFENSLLREEHGRNGLETVMKEFSVSAMIEKTRQVYRECV